MINPVFKKKVFELDQDQTQKNEVLGAKKIDQVESVKNEENKLRIKYYVVAFIWVEIIFLSFVLNSNFIGDYSNFIDDAQVQSENLSDESKYETLLAKSKAVFAFTIIILILTITQIIVVHTLINQSVLTITSILNSFFYLIRFILGIVFLTDSGKEGVFDSKISLDSLIGSNPNYCIENQPAVLKACRYVYSFNFLYGQEVFVLVSGIVIIPYIMFSQRYKQLKLLQHITNYDANLKHKTAMPSTAQIPLQDLNETKDYLKQDSQYHNTSIIQDNYVLQQRVVTPL